MTDFREKLNSLEEVIRSAMDDMKSNLHTAITGEVKKVNMSKMTVDIQPTIKSVIRKPDGTTETRSMPLLTDVPISFPGGGGMTMTFPVKEGDEAMVVFASRSTDSWYQSGGEQSQMDARTHDLSDGIAYVGVRSQSKVPANVSGESTEIRTDDGNTKIAMSGSGGLSMNTDKSVSIDAAAGVTIGGGGGGTSINGTVNVTGEIILNGIPLSTHKHTGVVPGGSQSGGPVA